MRAVWKREFLGYFRSPVGSIYLGIFFIFSGLFFYFNCLSLQYADVAALFLGMFSVLMYLLPLLTMRLFLEDRTYGTDKLLYTSPASVLGIVVGKILAAFTLFALAVSILLVYCGVFQFYSVAPQDFGMIASCFFGILLLGLAMISIGAFLSVISNNQIIAAISTFVIALFLNVTNLLASVAPWDWLSNGLNYISFSVRYATFIYGIVDLRSVIFFLSVTFLFGFYCVRVIERRQYVE